MRCIAVLVTMTVVTLTAGGAGAFWPVQVYDGKTFELKNPMRHRSGIAIARTGKDTYRITAVERKAFESYNLWTGFAANVVRAFEVELSADRELPPGSNEASKPAVEEG